MSFSIPENALTAALAYLIYTYFMRFTITFRSGRTVVFDDGRPLPFRWHSFIAMAIVMAAGRLLISRWVDAVASLQAK
jgi:hypothetical protein